MRILVTNDDGVLAPGLGALTRALARWAEEGPNREVIVVAPMVNFSGAGAAVGTVYERNAVAYRRETIVGAESVPTFGVDASPALSVFLGALGGLGPPPDLVVAGINHGVNVGRSILHSGTVGAAFTASQLGINALAVSLRTGADPDPFETAADLAIALLPTLEHAPTRTVLNLNVPALALSELKGIRHGKVGSAGIIKATVSEGNLPASGEIKLTLGAAVPSLGDISDEVADEDGALVAHGYASLTALRGPHESDSDELSRIVTNALDMVGPSLGQDW